MAEKKTQLVRYRWGKHTFEVMTQLGSVQKWRDGKLGLDNVLQSDVVRHWFWRTVRDRRAGAECGHFAHGWAFVDLEEPVQGRQGQRRGAQVRSCS